ncbi:MAG: hypothetical protein IBX44_00335 [Sulfurospirillum sp.]|nr:hypothetical protein [Sulfurospirillum sp.]
MSSKKFIAFVGLFAFLIVGFVGGVNYVVDPGYIYLKKYFSSNADAYSEALFSSENGLVATGWNERVVKASMAKYAGNFDCAVFGSSHIMQISQVRNIGNIEQVCPKLLNLGVSGGSIEDLFVFSDIALTNQKMPKKIFIGIDPWTFKFNMDTRYLMHQFQYNNFLSTLEGKKKERNNYGYELSLFKNLFNLEYLLTSMKEIKFTFKTSQIEFPNESYIFEHGYKEPLKLKDGSHLYSSADIVKFKNVIKTIKIGGGDYKISGNMYETQALVLFEKLIQLFQKDGIEVNFILTPYHPNVFKAGVTKPVKHIETMENLVIELSNKYKVNLYGSFYPSKVGCHNNEFLDFMHASSECLNKINFSRPNFSN